MRRPAERRAQASAEWAAVLLAIGAVLAGAALWHGGERPRAIAAALEPAPPEAAVDHQAVAAAITGRPDAISPLGMQAWLVETSGPDVARRVMTTAVASTMRHDHPRWGAELRVTGPPIRGRRPVSTVRVVGPFESRVITFADERERTAPPTPADRADAVATALGWQAAGSIARRIARPLGLAVSAIQLAVGLADDDAALPPGDRAGDVVVCRRAAVLTHGALPHRAPRAAWRIGVLRAGRLILDAVATEDPCRVPAGD